MARQRKPRQEVVRRAHKKFSQVLTSLVSVHTIAFPKALDTQGLYRHDFIFIRDSFIARPDGAVLVSNFSERQRQEEAHYMKSYLEDLGRQVHSISDGAYIEGGELHYLPVENLLFAGVIRNNAKGVAKVAKFLGVGDVCIVETAAFHLDTNMAVVKGANGACVGIFACQRAIKNYQEVAKFCNKHGLPLLPLELVDGIGTPRQLGTFAVNSLALPGVLVSCAAFATAGVEEKLKIWGIKHIVVPLEDLTFSGGSIHCLTNELSY